MPSLTDLALYTKLRSTLPENSRFETPPKAIHPAVVVIPGLGRARIYLWTVTADRSAPGARPPGEYKIQLILPAQGRHRRGGLDLEGAFVALLGYSPDFGVFVGWEARLYRDFAYSANVQTREELLEEARDSGWAVAPPRPQKEDEVRVAFTPGNLHHYLRTSRNADRKDQWAKWREAFFLAHTPNIESPPLPRTRRDLEPHVERERRRLTATRLERDAKFGAKVKEQYDHSCAVCSLQMEIIEGAHIIPVRESGSRDDIWNGVALCPNHHRLFDARSFVITSDLAVTVDPSTVAFLRESDRDDGIEVLTNFAGERIREPHFWAASAADRQRMQAALARRVTLAGLA